MSEYLDKPDLHKLTGYARPCKQAEWQDYILQQNELLIESPKIHPSVRGGIYALFSKDDILLYIGRTLNLNLRINRHFYDRKFGFRYFSAVDVPYEFMKNIEIAHIYALEPPGNILYERIDNPLHDEMVFEIRKAWKI